MGYPRLPERQLTPEDDPPEPEVTLEEADGLLQDALSELTRARQALVERNDRRRFALDQAWQILDSITPTK